MLDLRIGFLKQFKKKKNKLRKPINSKRIVNFENKKWFIRSLDNVFTIKEYLLIFKSVYNLYYCWSLFKMYLIIYVITFIFSLLSTLSDTIEKTFGSFFSFKLLNLSTLSNIFKVQIVHSLLSILIWPIHPYCGSIEIHTKVGLYF